MKLIPVLNNNHELEYYEHIEENGAVKKNVTVIPESDYFHITETIENGHKEIYRNDFILDIELLEAIKSL